MSTVPVFTHSLTFKVRDLPMAGGYLESKGVKPGFADATEGPIPAQLFRRG